MGTWPFDQVEACQDVAGCSRWLHKVFMKPLTFWQTNSNKSYSHSHYLLQYSTSVTQFDKGQKNLEIINVKIVRFKSLVKIDRTRKQISFLSHDSKNTVHWFSAATFPRGDLLLLHQLNNLITRSPLQHWDSIIVVYDRTELCALQSVAVKFPWWIERW